MHYPAIYGQQTTIHCYFISLAIYSRPLHNVSQQLVLSHDYNTRWTALLVDPASSESSFQIAYHLYDSDSRLGAKQSQGQQRVLREWVIKWKYGYETSWQLLTMAVWDHVTANNGEKTTCCNSTSDVAPRLKYLRASLYLCESQWCGQFFSAPL